MTRAVLLAALPAALLAVGLAGCAAPGPEEPDSLWAVCPHWQPRGAPVEGTVELTSGASMDQTLMPTDEADAFAPLSPGGRPFDMLQITILDGTVDGDATLVAAGGEDGDTRRIFDYGAQDGPRSLAMLSLAPGDQDERVLEVFLASVEEAAEPEPQPIRLTWQLAGNGTASLRFEVQYFDRVCGIG